MTPTLPRWAAAALAIAAAAPAAAISAHDAREAQAACTAAARERRIDVRAVRSLRNDGARRIEVVLETDRRTTVRCRWDRRDGHTEFPGHEGYTPHPLPPPQPLPQPRPQPRPQPQPRHVPGTPSAANLPIDDAARRAAVQICTDLAQMRITRDAPLQVLSVQRAGPAAIDVDLQADTPAVLRCRYDMNSRTARWR